VAACRFRQTLRKGLLEGVKVLIVGAGEAFFSDEFPQALDQIEIGGVSRQKQELNAKSSRLLHHEPTALRARIIHHHGDRSAQTQGSELVEPFAHAAGIDVAVIGHGNQLMGDGMQCCQDIEALPSARGTHQHASETPQPPQVGSQDEMGRIDKKEGALTGFSLLQPRL
jgi:hypothetical protein